jgi:hypothetical protein
MTLGNTSALGVQRLINHEGFFDLAHVNRDAAYLPDPKPEASLLNICTECSDLVGVSIQCRGAYCHEAYRRKRHGRQSSWNRDDLCRPFHAAAIRFGARIGTYR